MPFKKYKVQPFEPNITIKSRPQYKCPKCGGDVRRNDKIVLASYPPKRRYECDDCEYYEVF